LQHQISLERICQMLLVVLPSSLITLINPNFRSSKQILTYIYKSYLVFHDFTIFVTHGCYSGCCYNGKLMKNSKWQNFQSTKGFNASTREKWRNFSSDDERSTTRISILEAF
jgi:hypothetical protein